MIPKAYWEEMLGTVGSGSDFYRQMREVAPNPGHHAIARLEQLGIVKCRHHPERRRPP